MNKRKASLFSEFETDLDGSTPQVDDASHLQTLYPDAKTADELHQDDLQRQKLFESKLPRFFRLKITLSMSLAFAFLLAFSMSFGAMWDTGETGTVFQSFGLGLLLAFVVWICTRYMSKVFYTFGRSLKLFGFVYAGAAFTLYALTLYGLFGDFAGMNTALLASVTHAVISYVLLLVLFRV